MNGIEIRDMHPRGFLAFDLKDILACLSDEVVQRTWICDSVECTGEAAKELEDLSDVDGSVAGADLMALARRITHVIWGNFHGSLPGDTSPSIVVKAIDSTLWEVFGSERCLDRIRSQFQSVGPARYVG